MRNRVAVESHQQQQQQHRVHGDDDDAVFVEDGLTVSSHHRSTMTMSRSGSRQSLISVTNRTRCRIVAMLLLVVATVALTYLLATMTNHSSSVPNKQQDHLPRREAILLSTPLTTTVTASVRGNLGPPEVVLTNHTADWLKDRWQAASDMHGTAIRGPHWLQLQFRRGVIMERLVLDYESAYSEDYQVIGERHNSDSGSDDVSTHVLYDTAATAATATADHLPTMMPVSTTRQWGQSPGVKFQCPLHIEHNITLLPQVVVDTLRLVIRKPAKHGWGVSLWKIQVYGHYAVAATSLDGVA